MVSDNLSIRLYRPGDQDQIEWLQRRTPAAGQVAWREASVPDDLRRIPQTFAAFWVAVENRQNHAAAVIGMAGTTRVGAVSVGPPVPDFLNKESRTARLHRMRVAPERWRHGVGNELARVAIDWARDEKYRSMILETTPQQEAAVGLYRSLGFVERGHSALGPHDLIWFELEL